MKALILDDEAAGRQDMRQMLARHEDVKVVAEADTVEVALELTSEHKPDVAFVDVRLRGETAFEYVGKLGREKPRIVFVTAYESYAVRGFECNALDYILKPVLEERLSETLERVRTGVHLRREQAGPSDSIFLPIEGAARLVPWSEVDWIASEGNYTTAYMRDGQQAMILRTMKQWEELFPSGMFARAGRSVFVRLHAIVAICPDKPSGRKVVLDRGQEFRISRRYWPALKEQIVRWHPEAAQFLP